MPSLRILRLTPLDYEVLHAGRITRKAPHPLDSPVDEGIEESEPHLSVVRRVTAHGENNAMVMDDGGQYYLARVTE